MFAKECYKNKLAELNQNLSGSEIDTLIAPVEWGPLHDGEVPSKSGRDGLILKALAVKCVVLAEDGYQVATYLGRDVYKHRYQADTITEAMAKRKKMLEEN